MFFSSKAKKLVVVLVLLLLAGSLIAQEDSGEKRGSKRKLESWYHSLTFGLAPLTEAEGNDMDPDMAIGLDFLRFYFRVSDRLIIGPGIYATGLRYTDYNTQLNFYLFSASMQYYFKSVGDGFFLRGDLGFAKGVAMDLDAGDTSSSDMGFGGLIGAGYAIPISRETSLLLYGAFRVCNIEDVQYRDFSIQIGWLW